MFFEFLSRTGAEGDCGVKKKLQKTLFLAIVVIVSRKTYCIIFPSLAYYIVDHSILLYYITNLE